MNGISLLEVILSKLLLLFSENEPTLEGKNLLPLEQILSFLSRSPFQEGTWCAKQKKKKKKKKKKNKKQKKNKKKKKKQEVTKLSLLNKIAERLLSALFARSMASFVVVKDNIHCYTQIINMIFTSCNLLKAKRKGQHKKAKRDHQFEINNKQSNL